MPFPFRSGPKTPAPRCPASQAPDQERISRSRPPPPRCRPPPVTGPRRSAPPPQSPLAASPDFTRAIARTSPSVPCLPTSRRSPWDAALRLDPARNGTPTPVRAWIHPSAALCRLAVVVLPSPEPPSVLASAAPWPRSTSCRGGRGAPEAFVDCEGCPCGPCLPKAQPSRATVLG